MVLFVNPLTPRVKPWVIQIFLTFDSMDRALKCDHSLKAVEQYFTVVLFVCLFFFFNFAQFIILECLSIFDLALSGVKGLNFLSAIIFILLPSSNVPGQTDVKIF